MLVNGSVISTKNSLSVNRMDETCLPTLQEKMKGKNKLVPRLLGITKESVMRVDEKTKEVMQEWSLTNIKRWAASPKSFTLVSSILVLVCVCGEIDFIYLLFNPVVWFFLCFVLGVFSSAISVCTCFKYLCFCFVFHMLS